MPIGIYKRTEETKEKLSKAHKGIRLSEETKKKMSQSRMGHIGYMKGKKHSEETKLKMSLIKKGKTPKNIGMIAGWNKGKKWSKEIKEKMGKARVGKGLGERNRLWKGGKMSEYPINDRIRKSSEYRIWRKACFERDNFTCQKTGLRGGELVVHHINNFADFPELRLSMDNGITLLKKVHDEFHSLYGKKNNTREQLQEFLSKQ